MDKNIYEGWTANDFIKALTIQLDTIQSGRSWKQPITSKKELKNWLKDNQPYYKKHIPKVYHYFIKRYDFIVWTD